MLTHVVLLKLPEGSDLEEVEELVRRLRTLPEHVPVIRSLEAGVNEVPSERAYDVGLVVRLDDLEALEAYQVHPYHQEVLAYVRSFGGQSAAADFTP